MAGIYSGDNERIYPLRRKIDMVRLIPPLFKLLFAGEERLSGQSSE